MRLRAAKPDPDMDVVARATEWLREFAEARPDEEAKVELRDGRSVRVVPLDGRLLNRCVVAGALRGDSDTTKFLAAIGDAEAEQIVQSVHNAARLLAEDLSAREIVLEQQAEDDGARALAAVIGTETHEPAWADDPEERLYQRLASATGVRR